RVGGAGGGGRAGGRGGILRRKGGGAGGRREKSRGRDVQRGGGRGEKDRGRPGGGRGAGGAGGRHAQLRAGARRRRGHWAAAGGEGGEVGKWKVGLASGLGLETWLEKLYQAAGSRGELVWTAAKVPRRTMVEEGHEEIDPHCWQNVENVMTVAGEVRDALT